MGMLMVYLALSTSYIVVEAARLAECSEDVSEVRAFFWTAVRATI